MGEQVKILLKNCAPEQVVLWRPDGLSFRWLLLGIKKRWTYQIEVEVLACPALVYAPDSKYAVGKTSVWRSETAVVELNAMEVLAWASA